MLQPTCPAPNGHESNTLFRYLASSTHPVPPMKKVSYFSTHENSDSNGLVVCEVVTVVLVVGVVVVVSDVV